MTQYINRAIIQGNLGSDPSTIISRKGDKFTTFSIATQIDSKWFCTKNPMRPSSS